MNKDEFLQHLKDRSVDPEIQLQCCQYFVDNYSVWIDQIIQTPFGNIPTGYKTYTKLEGYSVKNDNFAMKNLNKNFLKLVERYDEITKFNEYDKK